MPVTIDQILQKIDKMPEPPKASVQAVNMLEDPNVPIAKVAEFISMDECLTSKLLKLSNSAHYGFSGKISTVKEALMRIEPISSNALCTLPCWIWPGLNRASSLSNCGNPPCLPPWLPKMWENAWGTLSVDLCFTGGLLCDIGQLLMNEFANQIYTNLVKEVRKGGA